MELTTLEKHFSDRIGCEVSTISGRIGINLGLNFITELSGHRKISKPKIKGVHIFLTEEKKVVTLELSNVKFSNEDSVVIKGYEEIIREFLIYFFLIDEIGVSMSKSFGKSIGVEVSFVEEIIGKYKKIGWNKNSSGYVEES